MRVMATVRRIQTVKVTTIQETQQVAKAKKSGADQTLGRS